MTFEFIKAEKTEDIVEPVKEPVVDLSQYLQENPTIPDTSMCSTCPASDKMNMLPVQGEGRLGIMVVLSHPTKGDIDMGRYSASQSYVHMAKYLDKIGVDIDRDCWVTSAVRCNAGGMIPDKKAFECCRPRLKSTVKRFKPFVVFVVGRNAMSGWKGHQFSIPPRVPIQDAYKPDTDFTRWVGNQIPDMEYSFDYSGEVFCPVVCPLFNPSDVSAGESKNMKRRKIDSVIPLRESAFIRRGVELAAKIQEDPLRYIKIQESRFDRHPKATVLVRTLKDALSTLEELNSASIVAFDYETTGLKPYNKGHRILMVGIASEKATYAIPFYNTSKEFMQAYTKLMTNPSVKKIAHNAKFEYNWTRQICKFDISPMYYDTMIGAHIADMRDGTTGLKMQGYLQYGDAGYEKVTKKLIRPATPGKRKNSNDMNWLQYLDPNKQEENEVVWELMLKYVAQDAALTLALYYTQRKAFASKDIVHLNKGMKLFMESMFTMADMEFNGFRFSHEEAKASIKDINSRMQALKEQMHATAEYAKWVTAHPEKELNISSPIQLREFLYTLLAYEPVKYTKTNNPSTDKEAIEKLNTPYTNLLAEYKELGTVKNTFLVAYSLEANDDGNLRGFLDLTNVKSYRTSSNSPNMQNCSKRNASAPYIRRTLMPREGQVLVESDFHMLEVCGNACISKDRALVEYTTNPEADMHSDIGGEALFYEPKELPKKLRQLAKTFVFLEFYGGGYRKGARDLWYKIGKKEQDRLKQFGIQNYPQFEEHMRQVEYNMWHNRFTDFMAWRKLVFEFYTKYGYFIGPTGFIYDAPDLDAKQCGNFPAQGSGSHILLSTANYANTRMKSAGMKSMLISQIHDSVISSNAPSELTAYVDILHDALKAIYEKYPWIIVPLSIEVEVSEVNGNMSAMKPYAVVTKESVVYL